VVSECEWCTLRPRRRIWGSQRVWILSLVAASLTAYTIQITSAFFMSFSNCTSSSFAAVPSHIKSHHITLHDVSLCEEEWE
jgi:hypothetical protein